MSFGDFKSTKKPMKFKKKTSALASKRGQIKRVV